VAVEMMVGVKSSPYRSGRVAAVVMAAATHRRRSPRPADPVLHIPADQMPAKALARLRHPSTPPAGYVVRWDPVTMTAVWQPYAVGS
jgi:hypothetical protein